MLRLDFRILGADCFEHTLPETSGMGHGVGLVAHQNLAARRAVEFGVRLAVFEGVTNDALYAFASVDVFLRGDLVGSSLFEDAARVGVNAFGVFAQNNKVNV